MRFRMGNQRPQTDWEPWFAWHPVLVFSEVDGQQIMQTVWCERLLRRWVQADYEPTGRWRYRWVGQQKGLD